MASPEPFRRIAAENKGSGTLPIHSGLGDQGVLKGDNSTQNLIRSQKVFNITLSSKSHLAELIHQGDDGFDLPTRVVIIEWLKLHSQLDFRAHHQTLLDQMVPGTGTWAMDNEGFQAWINGSNPSRFFWIHGILGSGKTMLSSLIIDSIEKVTEEIENTACIYVYFQDGQDQPSETRQDQRPTFANIVMNLLIQLLQCQSSDSIVEELQAKYNRWRTRMISPTSEDYVNLFTAELATFERVYLVVDALDNCLNTPKENTHDKIQDALRNMPDNVKVLVTSRSGHLDSWCLQEEQMFELKPSRDDVEKYVKSRIRDDKDLQRKIAQEPDPKFQDKVVQDVADATTGIFLLTKLHMDYLSERETLGDIKPALKTLPQTVDSAFEKSIEKIQLSSDLARKKHEPGLAQHVLTWVVNSVGPVNAAQICHSFAIRRSGTTLNKDYLPAEAKLISACAGLVTMDPKTKVLSLVHESVLNYLWSHGIVPTSSDMDLAKMCLKYLLSKDSDDDTERPLLDYASMHWLSHYSMGEKHVDDEAEDLAMQFLHDKEKVQASFQLIAGKDSLALHSMTGLHAAIYFKRAEWAEKLIEQGVKVDAACSDNRTALHWAAKIGRSDLVELLTQRSADTNAQDRNGNTPLHLALMWSPKEDCAQVVQKLVEAGARVDIPGGRGYTPLTWTMRYGPSSIAKLLAENLVDVDAEHQGWSMLRTAMDEGHRDVIEILLKKGVDLNKPSSADGWTPLRKVVQDGDIKMVRRLLKMGVKVDLRDNQDGYSPLRWAVIYKHLSIVQLLLHHGADANEAFKDGSTVLIEAIKTNEDSIVWTLVQYGAHLDAQDKRGWTALHHAVKAARNSLIWLLIMKKATVTIRDEKGLNCLDLAVQKNDLSVVWLLCENGAKADDANDAGMAALHLASWLGHLEIVRFFLDRKTSTSAKDKIGDTALHRAVRQKHKEVVGLLASRGAEANVEDQVGLTPLAIAMQAKDKDMMQVLLENGASGDVKYQDGMTALHQAIDQKFTEGVRILLKGSSDPDIKDKNGFAALHRAVWFDNEELLTILVEGGANVDVRDGDDRTPLIHAVQMGKEKLVTVFLKAGADITPRAKNGWTAVEFAGHHGIIRGLLQSVGTSG